jgi:DNA adenine methylase
MDKFLKLPYPYCGGKTNVADLIWKRLGDVDHYIEPFFGGGGVFLRRPHPPRHELINDSDGFICNFWRAVKAEPEIVAELVDDPVNEIDMEARHRFLCCMPDKEDFLSRMRYEPEYYDVKRAAWWVWGLSAWLGKGWCEGQYYPNDRSKSVGCGIREGASKRPHLNYAEGVNRGSIDDMLGYIKRLSIRMRYVNVCCGDWSRVCTDSILRLYGVQGVMLDPPYSLAANRMNAIYRTDDTNVANLAREWCKQHCDIRIALCGLDGEHNELESMGWSVVNWKSSEGYAKIHRSGHGVGKANSRRECVWFSPACIGE